MVTSINSKSDGFDLLNVAELDIETVQVRSVNKAAVNIAQSSPSLGAKGTQSESKRAHIIIFFHHICGFTNVDDNVMYSLI